MGIFDERRKQLGIQVASTTKKTSGSGGSPNFAKRRSQLEQIAEKRRQEFENKVLGQKYGTNEQWLKYSKTREIAEKKRKETEKVPTQTQSPEPSYHKPPLTQTSSPTFTTTPTVENLPITKGPSYRERVAERLKGVPEFLKPIAQIGPLISEAPFSLSMREALGTSSPEEKAFQPVKGAGRFAGQALSNVGNIIFSGTPTGGIYSSLVGGAEKAVPALATSVAGRVGTRLGAGMTEGAIQGVAEQMITNPDSSREELLQAAKWGSIFGTLPGAGRVGVELRDFARGKAADFVQGNIKTIMDDIGVIPRKSNGPIRATVVKPTGDTISASRTTPDSVGEEVKVGESVPARVTPPTQQGRSRFAQTTLPNSDIIIPEVAEALRKSENINYQVGQNVEQVARANQTINEVGAEKVIDNLLDRIDTDGKLGGDGVALGIRAIQEVQKTDIERAVRMAENLSQRLTKAGQELQATRIIERLSPEGQLLNFVRTAERAGKKVKPADAKAFLEQAEVRQAGDISKTETSDFMKTLDKFRKGENVTEQEIKQALSVLEEAKGYVKQGKTKAPTPELSNVRTRDKVLSYFEKQATEARKAWDAKRGIGFAQRLEEPDIVLLAKMAAYKVAKGVVNVADFTEYLVKEFGESVRPYAQAVYDRARDVVRSTSKGISEGKLQEATEAFERLTKGRTDAEKVANKFMKENKLNAKDVEKINDLVKDLNDLKGAKATDAEIQMQKIMNKYTKSSIKDKLNVLRYIAMLLNTITQSVNALSGPIMASSGAIFDLFGSMAEMVLAPIMKRQRTTALWGSNPLQFLVGFGKNLKTGAKAGWHGAEPSGIKSQSDIRGLTFKSNYNPLNWLERSLGAVSRGPDYGTYKSVFDSEIKRQAGLNASRKGLKGKDRKAYIDNFIVNPPEEAIEIADNIGKTTTFQRQDSVGGQTAQALASAAKNYPKVGKYVDPTVRSVFPFIKTMLNIATTAAKLTPAGGIKGLLTLARGDLTPAMQRDAVRELGMGITGTGIGALGYYLSDLGIITGANDSGNKDVDALREQAGKGKYRFNTSALMRFLGAALSGEGESAAREAAKYREGDKQFDYNKLQPLALPLAAGASAQESGGNVGKILTDASGSLLGMSALTGLQNVTQKPLQGTLAEKALQLPANIIESYLKSFSPSLLAQEARRQDTTQRKTPYAEGIIPDVKGYFQSRFPGKTQNLPPRITALGDTPQYPGGIGGQYLNPYRSESANFNKAAVIISDLIDRTKDMNLAPTSPLKYVEGGGKTVDIPPERYIKYQEDIGREITRQILNLGPMSDEKKVEKIKDIYSKVKEKYRNQLKKELGIKVRR